jgi:hypothetical protein
MACVAVVSSGRRNVLPGLRVTVKVDRSRRHGGMAALDEVKLSLWRGRAGRWNLGHRHRRCATVADGDAAVQLGVADLWQREGDATSNEGAGFLGVTVPAFAALGVAVAR